MRDPPNESEGCISAAGLVGGCFSGCEAASASPKILFQIADSRDQRSLLFSAHGGDGSERVDVDHWQLAERSLGKPGLEVLHAQRTAAPSRLRSVSYADSMTRATPGCRFMSNESHLTGDGTNDLGATRTAPLATRYLAAPATADCTPRRRTGQATTRVTRARTAHRVDRARAGPRRR
jgi:hypothetical protein